MKNKVNQKYELVALLKNKVKVLGLQIKNRLTEDVAQYNQVVQGKQGEICEIVHQYIEQITTKFDTAIRRLDEARRLSY